MFVTISDVYFITGPPSGPVPERVVGKVVIIQPSPLSRDSPQHDSPSPTPPPATHPADLVSTASTPSFVPQDPSPENLDSTEGILFLNGHFVFIWM
jgi:hypothetical protein